MLLTTYNVGDLIS